MSTKIISIILPMALCAPVSLGQRATPPTAFTVTETTNILVPNQSLIAFRDGDKALVDTRVPAGGDLPKAVHRRTYYDLKTRIRYMWDVDDPSSPCETLAFAGDWGDPFATSADMLKDMKAQHFTEGGTEIMNGLPTKVVEADSPDGKKAKAWLDSKTGLIVKLIMAKGAETRTLIDVQAVSFSAPPASVFQLPPTCAKAAASAGSSPGR